MEALGTLARSDNGAGAVAADRALREAVKVALNNQLALATALGRLKLHMDEEERSF